MASKPHFAGLLTLLIGLAAGAGCSKKAPGERPDRSPAAIYAVSYPLAYFAERLSPESVVVRFPVPEGTDPAFWRPSAETIAAYQHADRILLNGAGYAGWTRYATLSKAKLVITVEGCRDALLPSEETPTHRHGPEGEHAHGDLAFTTWLDLRLALCQAGRVRDALVELAPEDEAAIEDRFARLEAELLSVDADLRKAGGALRGRPILASHPVYQYLADAYALSITSLHLEPDRPLGPDELRALDAALEGTGATLMLWEGPPLDQTREELARRSVKPIVYDPVSRRPSSGDFVTEMRANAARLGCAAGTSPCQ